MIEKITLKIDEENTMELLKKIKDKYELEEIWPILKDRECDGVCFVVTGKRDWIGYIRNGDYNYDGGYEITIRTPIFSPEETIKEFNINLIYEKFSEAFMKIFDEWIKENEK